MIDQRSNYFKDHWSAIDLIILGIIGFVLLLNLDAVHNIWNIDPLKGDISTYRIIAGFGCFLNWIKLFYWMRLFDGLAFYV